MIKLKIWPFTIYSDRRVTREALKRVIRNYAETTIQLRIASHITSSRAATPICIICGFLMERSNYDAYTSWRCSNADREPFHTNSITIYKEI